MKNEPPIQHLDKMDIVGERVDGDLDLVIVASGPLDDSPETLHALRHKILNYLSEAGAPGLRTRYNVQSNATIRIIIDCKHSVSEAAKHEIELLRVTARDAGLLLELET